MTSQRPLYSIYFFTFDTITKDDTKHNLLPLFLSLSHAAAVQTAVQEKTPAAHNQRGHRGDREGFERGQHTPHRWPWPGGLLGGLPPLHLPPGPPHLPQQGCFPLQQTFATGRWCQPEAAAVTPHCSIRQLWIRLHRGDACHPCAPGRGERTRWHAHVWQLWPPRVSLWTPEQPLRRREEGSCRGTVHKATWEPMGKPGSPQSPQHPSCFESWSPTPTQEQLPRVTRQRSRCHPKHLPETKRGHAGSQEGELSRERSRGGGSDS